jgi:hypothetical protein
MTLLKLFFQANRSDDMCNRFVNENIVFSVCISIFGNLLLAKVAIPTNNSLDVEIRLSTFDHLRYLTIRIFEQLLWITYLFDSAVRHINHAI